MSAIYELYNLSDVEKNRIAKKLVVRAKTQVGREMKLGNPIKLFFRSDDAQYVFVPKTWGLANLTKKPLGISIEKKEYVFTGTLRDTEQNDQDKVTEEALQFLNTKGTVFLELRTGFGKTICSTYLSSKLGYKTIILLNMSSLLEQWAEAYRKNTTANVHIVSVKSKEIDMNNADVLICMIGRFKYISQENRDNIGTLILDETRELCVQTAIAPILNLSPYYIIACSATPERKDGLHSIIDSVVGTDTHIIRKLKCEMNLVKLNTGLTFPMLYNASSGVDWLAISKSTVLSKNRMQCALEQIINTYKNEKILVFVWYRVHAELVFEILKLYGVDVSIYYGSQTSYKNARVLIGSLSKCGIGFDEQSCKSFDNIRINTLILLSSTAQTELLIQYIGRVTRANNPTIVYPYDENPVLKKHWRLAYKWFTDEDKKDLLKFTETDWKFEQNDRFDSIFEQAAKQVDLEKRFDV
jgi:superfamily II DNA or RNA helicase